MKKIVMIIEDVPENLMMDMIEQKEVTVTGIAEEVIFMDSSEDVEKTCDTCKNQKTIDFDSTCDGCIRQHDSFDKWEQRK